MEYVAQPFETVKVELEKKGAVAKYERVIRVISVQF